MISDSGCTNCAIHLFKKKDIPKSDHMSLVLQGKWIPRLKSRQLKLRRCCNMFAHAEAIYHDIVQGSIVPNQ